MRLTAVLATALLGSVAVAQVTIPPHASIYNGFSRGFAFTAQVPFFIVGLDLPTDAFQAGDTAGYLVRLNGTTALHSVGNAGAIATNIQVNQGDVVDIIGNWSPAAPGNFTAHNSYTASMTNFATTIEGVPHTIQRNGWQWDIGVLPLTGVYLAPTTGAMGRINMYTSSGGSGSVIATNTTLGAGCVRQFGSFYENFGTAVGFDLANTALTMLPTGTGYVVLQSGAFLPVGSIATPVSLALTDDSEVTVPFTTGAFPGWTGVTVCSNGYVSKASGNGTGFTPTVATFLAGPQDWFSLGWHDFNPAAAGSGTVKLEESAAVTVITWDAVYDFGGTTAANANTMQLQLYANGQVVMAWGTMSTLGNGFLAGYSPGGASGDPGNTDISGIGTGSIVLAVPEVSPLTLTASSRPVINTNWNLSVTNVPATGVLGVDIFGLADPGINDLAFLGLPGCGLRSSLDSLNAWLPSGSSHTYSFALPNVPALVNQHLFTTSAVFQPGVNSFGAITANGIDGKIGDL